MSQIQLPSNLSQILTICRYELLIGIKGKKIPAILGITVGITLALIIVPEILEVEHSNSSFEYFLMPIGFGFFLFIITAALFGSNSLVSEFHERTGYSLFPNPVTRTTIWFGKFLSAEVLGFIVISIFYGMLSIGTYAIYNEVPSEIFESFLLSFVIVTMVMSVSFFISSFSRGPTGAVVLVFVIFILILPIVDQFLINFAETKPWFSPTFIQQINQNILFDPYPIDLEPGEMPRGPFDFKRFVPYVDESLAIMFSYIVLFSLASIYLFKRREMTS